MAVDFLVNEAQLSRFQDLSRSKQTPADSLFTITLPDRSVYPYTGKISVIDRSVDPQTGTVRIRLEFPNPKYTLRAGMSCIVRVHNTDRTPQIVIPGKAVVEQMGEYFVFVVKDTVIMSQADSAHKETADTVKGPKLRAFQKKVMLGQTVDDKVIVKKGISEGDVVVIDGVQALHEGSKVAVSNKPDGNEAPASEKKTAEGKMSEDKK
jgi:membrane fusion protein (multidrug efflux system)